MEDILVKRREVFFNNLILLGLDKPTLEKKHGISFNRDMFVLPNKKGFEIVSHFLFSKLSLATGKDYNLPWPLLGKEHDRIFQKTCYAHFSSFAEENDVKFPRLVPSIISTFGGDRFYEVYVAFSSYVLCKTIKKNGNITLLSTPTFNRETFPICEEIMKLSTFTCMQKFRDTEKVTAVCHLVWAKFAKDLSECLQKLKALLKTSEELLRKNWSTACSLYSTPSNESLTLQKLTEKNIECWKLVIDKFKKLDDFFSNENKFWQHLASEVQEGQDNPILNGQNFDIGITDNLPENCRLELEKVGCTSSKIGEKLSIVRYIKFLTAYLKYMMEVLRKADLSKLHENCSVDDPNAIQDSLLYVNNLNKRFEEEIPDIKSNIEKLKETAGFENSLVNLDASIKQCFPSIPLQSYSIEAVKERVSCFKPGAVSELLYANDKAASFNLDSTTSFLFEIITEKYSSTNVLNYDADKFNISTLSGISTNKEIPLSNFSVLDSLKKEKNLLTCINESKVPSEDSGSCTQRITVASLNDIDFAPSTFQMRESWLEEESLNAMTLSNLTLPDLSFDDNVQS